MESRNFEGFPNQTSARVPDETSREELERLLAFAEQLEDKRDISAARDAFIRVVDTFVYVGLYASLMMAGAYFTKYFASVLTYVFVASAIGFCLAITWYIRLRRWRKQIAMQAFRDQIALGKTVELLRELQPLVAQREGWSALNKVAFRIRLERFDIAPSRPHTGDDTANSAQVQSSIKTTPAPAELRASVDSVQSPPTVTLQNH